jgi:hypothetical protein
MYTIDIIEERRRLSLIYDDIRIKGLDEKARDDIEELLHLVRKSGEHDGFYETKKGEGK